MNPKTLKVVKAINPKTCDGCVLIGKDELCYDKQFMKTVFGITVCENKIAVLKTKK